MSGEKPQDFAYIARQKQEKGKAFANNASTNKCDTTGQDGKTRNGIRKTLRRNGRYVKNEKRNTYVADAESRYQTIGNT